MRRSPLVCSAVCALGIGVFWTSVAAAQDGPVAAYGFEEGAGGAVQDASGHGNHGTVSGAAWTGAGRFGRALRFDGLNDSVAIPDAASLNLSSAITIEAWVNPASTSGRRPVLAKEDANGTVYAIHAAENGSKPSAQISVNGPRQADAVSQLLLNVWTHLAATYDGTMLRLFVNGVEVGSRAVSGPIVASSSPLRIGGHSVRADFFAGFIDEVRVYARALSPAEIQADMATPVVPPPPADSAPPSVTITSPAGGIVSGLATVSATASDDTGVAGVQFQLDGAPLGPEDTSAPFGLVWDTRTASNGAHALTAVARDAAGNQATAAPVTVTVANAAAPSVTISAPADGTTVSGPVTVSATATDDNGVVGVQFQLDGTALGVEDTAAPFTVLWDTTSVSNGPHTLSAIARDTGGNQATAVPVAVTVANDLLAPSVTITAPAGGTTVTGNIAVSAAASDDVGVAGVQFLLDAIPLGAEDILAPFSVTWDTTIAANGTHALTAIARDGAGHQTTSSPVTVTVSNITDPTSPSLVGQWSAPTPWPLVAVHMTLLHTGEVLAWEGQNNGGASATLWNPATGEFQPVPNTETNLFCSSHSALADGRILVAGGHGATTLGTPDANIYDPVTRQWTAAPPMSFARWYPTSTTLADGRVVVVGGAQDCFTCIAEVPEVYDPVANAWTQLPGARINLPLYPYDFVKPDGQVVNAGANEGTTFTRSLDVELQAWTTVDPAAVDGGSAAMYRPGKIIKSGSSSRNTDLPSVPSAATTYVIDTTEPAPQWRETASMAFPRSHHTLTLLPDGSVVVTGGERMTDGIDVTEAVLEAEIWSPATETWSTMAAMQTPRLYHGTALLLPDARVLVAGSGRLDGATDQLSAEIYSPPYLFKGPRPTIASAPTRVEYANEFVVDTPDATDVTSVVLIRPGSVTHTFDRDQRLVELTFRQAAGALTVDAPANGNIAPPGYYMLFLVNGSGVPSVASFVRLPSPAEDAQAPTAPTGLNAAGGIGLATLTWNAASDNKAVVAYNVHRATTSGFTPTLLNRVAQASGTSYVDAGLAAGSYFYVVTAQDAAGNVSLPSNEAAATVSADSSAPSVAITSPADGAPVSGTITVAASATDDLGVAGVQFLLDGVSLGAEDTTAPYSIAWNSAGAANGSHVLSAIARDATGNRTQAAPVTVTVSNTTPAPSGLVASYNFDAGAGQTLIDTSGNGNTGTISGAQWTTAGHTGNALSFNGVDDWVTVNDSASLALSTGMTLEAWVFPTVATNWRTAILKERVGGLSYALYTSNDLGLPDAYVRFGQDVGATGGAPLAGNAWSHIAATFDGATLRLFVNGAQVASRSVGGPIELSPGSPLRFGGNSVWGEFFAGRLDDIRIYNRALTQTEIQGDLQTPVP